MAATRTDPVGRARDAAATKAELLRAATRRFTLYGYDRTTSRQVAAEAGANVSLINRYFGSKEGLYQAAVEQTGGTLARLGATDTAELIDQALDGLLPSAWPEYGHEHPLLLLLHSHDGDDRTTRLRRRVLGSVLASIVELNDVPDGPDADLRAGLLMALIAGLLVVREKLPTSAIGTIDPADLRPLLHAVAGVLTAP